ncbi:DUF2254 domain-containing protein [uncultured Psychroserpens sp.]|uniref:DUF2254 domain-containing protein n=1 Tax=uncultured Psychroserpens sp. TaxID=255436 RepID=UPI00260287A8|nr:DUF2254 domain-containing protein [uncultured Psychroserpens sp.]
MTRLESKIAFYPTLISLAGLLFALFMYYLESEGISDYLVENAPILVVNDTETARSLLTTFIAGLISIMVFSFSLVMILLNQASSNYSPRVLPGLISNKRHQIVLGVYNSTLLYCIFTLVAIEPNGSSYQLPGFSVLLAILFMIFCLGAFIYFIHSISQEIQINNIMERIFNEAKSRIETLIDNEKDITDEFPDTSNWTVIQSSQSGYYHDVNINLIKSISKEKQLKFEIIPVKGNYVLKELPLVKISNKIDKELEGKILDAIRFSKGELIRENYVLAFKQITEIALKAMSPGINDPGTAINAIDYLTELFAVRLKKNDLRLVCDDEGNAILNINTVSFNDLLFQVMASLRTYCKHDPIILQKLLLMLNFLKQSGYATQETHKNAIDSEIENLIFDAKNQLHNKADLDALDRLISS